MLNFIVVGLFIGAQAAPPNFMQSTVTPTCMDQSGKPVDWFIVYKLPELKDSSRPAERDGVEFLYQDSASRGSWQLSEKTITEEQQAVAYTLGQVTESRVTNWSTWFLALLRHGARSDIAYLFYNDQPPPKGDNEDHGHTKGALAFNRDGGFWLISSVPHFPDFLRNGYNYPHTGHRYGQMMLCTSLPYKQFQSVGRHMYYNHPFVFDFSFPDAYKSDNGEMYKAIQGKYPLESPYYIVQTIKTVAGQSFTGFAKGGKLLQDLYHALVAPGLQAPLIVESWRNDRSANIPSYCNGSYSVYNNYQEDLPTDIIFTIYEDHSKWAVSVNSAKPWVCVGDINREVSQFHRGGGTFCMRHKQVWNSFRKSVERYDGCPTLVDTGPIV